MSVQLQYQIALTLVPQVGVITAKSLIAYCGGAEGVFRAKKQELLKIPGIGVGTANYILSAEPLQLAEAEIDFIERHDVQAVFFKDERYPARLRQNADCPILLYFKGSDFNLLNALRIVAIVGTRQPTEQGRAICEDIAEELRSYGVVLVSGLAYGIDIAAHRKATAVGTPNFGVLGHGLGSIYPAQHKSTALRMMENGGLLSEYTHQTGPDREHFPMRNRIIAGLCDALLVVETGASGGSMISAELACQYEREVFAIPGRVRDPKSAGCNQLIKNGRAKLAECAEDIAKAMHWKPIAHQQGVQTQLFPDLSPLEKQVLDIVRRQPEIPIDELVFSSGMSSGELASLILGLEFKGLIRTLPGKRYTIV